MGWYLYMCFGIMWVPLMMTTSNLPMETYDKVFTGFRCSTYMCNALTYEHRYTPISYSISGMEVMQISHRIQGIVGKAIPSDAHAYPTMQSSKALLEKLTEFKVNFLLYKMHPALPARHQIQQPRV